MDVAWDAHYVRHVCGISDPLEWVQWCTDSPRGLLSVSAYADPGAGYETLPLSDWASLWVSLDGVLLLLADSRLTARPELARSWHCDDCDRTRPCGAQLPPIWGLCPVCWP